MTPRLRDARVADAPAIGRIARASFARGMTDDEVRAELARAAAWLGVAEGEGRVLGYALVWVVADEAELHALAVAPGARGRGIGGRLLAHALAVAAARGARAMHLEVRAADAVAARLYARAGFEEVAVRRGYYADGDDARIMARPVR